MRTALPPITPSAPPRAISYIRFSSPQQAQGDSLRRQIADTEAWCRKNGIPLDTTLTLRDLGVSAFRGKHRDEKAALGTFLDAVRQGKVPRGSYLVIENLDRLSREEERTALRFWLDILDAGVNIVQLHPETVFRHERSDMTDIIRAIIELSRGHSESRMKSVRIAAAWAEKVIQARANGALLTRRLPAWIEEKEGRLQLIPERAAAVKRILALSATGYGLACIVKRLTAEGFPAFGDRETGEDGKARARDGKPLGSGRWTRGYVSLILRDRRVLGELPPRRRKGGEPILGYYPPAATEAEWYAAVAGSASRKPQTRGRLGNHVNIFAGLLHDARDGGSYYASTRLDRGQSYRVLLNSNGAEGLVKVQSFPLPTFEKAVLSRLREIDPSEVLGQSQGPDNAAVLQGELDWIAGRKAGLQAELLKGDVAAIAQVLRDLEARELELAAQLEGAKEKAVKPLEESWKEARNLGDLLDAGPDPEDVRLRLRAALRRIVDGIWLLVVARGKNRLCAVQLWFADGQRCRSYLILHRPARFDGKARQEGGWSARSLADVARPDDLDLRKPEDARELEAALLAVDVDALAEAG